MKAAAVLACLALTVGVGACSPRDTESGPPQPAAVERDWLGDRLQKEISGLTVRLVPSESQDIVAQIKAAQGYSPYDAMPNGEPPHLIAMQEGYIQKLDESRLSNIDNVIPEFMAKTGGYGVPATFSLIGIAYNEEMVANAPTGWADLWNEEYADNVGICRTSSNLGLGTLAIVAKIFGGSEENLEPGWQKLKELNAIAGRSPRILAQMMERGEIAVAPLWNNDAAVAAEKGLPIKFVKPDPGPVAIMSMMSEITGTASLGAGLPLARRHHQQGVSGAGGGLAVFLWRDDQGHFRSRSRQALHAVNARGGCATADRGLD